MEKTLSSWLEDARDCYDKAGLTTFPALRKVLTHWTFGPDGSVHRIDVEGDAVPADYVSCLRSTTEGCALPMTFEREKTIAIVLDFQGPLRKPIVPVAVPTDDSGARPEPRARNP